MAAAAGKKRRCPSRVEAEFEVQRNIKRAELTAFSCLRNRVIGSIKVYVDNKGIISGLRERRKIVHQANSGRCRFMDQNLGRTALFGRKGILVEVQHVKAHHTKKRKERYDALMRSSSPKAMRRPMSWQKKEHYWTQGLWQKQDRKLCSRRGRRCTQLCSMRPASTAW